MNNNLYKEKEFKEVFKSLKKIKSTINITFHPQIEKTLEELNTIKETYLKINKNVIKQKNISKIEDKIKIVLDTAQKFIKILEKNA